MKAAFLFRCLHLLHRLTVSLGQHHEAYWKNWSRSGLATGWTLGQAARLWTLQGLLHYNLWEHRSQVTKGSIARESEQSLLNGTVFCVRRINKGDGGKEEGWSSRPSATAEQSVSLHKGHATAETCVNGRAGHENASPCQGASLP